MKGWAVSEYDEDQDLLHINKWLKERKHPEIDAYDVPDIGYVANYKSRPVAAGFLRMVEGENAWFDSLITNPGATPEFRHIALDLVVEAILNKAKLRGIAKIIAFSVDEGTLKRALRHNFVQLPHTVISLDLKNGPSH